MGEGFANRSPILAYGSRRDRRGSWSTVGGVVAGIAATGGVAWLIAGNTKGTGIHVFPALWMFIAVVVVGLYVMLAPLREWWPWQAGQSDDDRSEPPQRPPSSLSVTGVHQEGGEFYNYGEVNTSGGGDSDAEL
jgi:hypothetical protein